MGRKNKRKKTEYRDRLGFNPWKYIRANTAEEQNRDRYPKTDRTPQRGDIWFVNLDPHAGNSVQGGCRPVLVISNNIGNAYAETLNVLPMTRQMKKPNLPCHTQLDPDAVSDKHQILDASMILAEQITTISKDQMKNYVGHVQDKALLNAVNHAVSVQLGLIPAAGSYDYAKGAQ